MRWNWIAGSISAVFAVFSVGLAVCGFGEPFSPQNKIKVAQALVLGAWIVLPPIWFWLEYYFIYLKETQHRLDLEHFKYGQDVAAKIWLALVTLLFGLYFGKDLIHSVG